MVQEGTQFQSLAHPNVCPLLGIVDGDGGKPLLVYPRVSHGNRLRPQWLPSFTEFSPSFTDF